LGGVKVECKGQDCPYYKDKKCSESAALSVLVPELKGAGVWEIVTGSFHSIVNINSCLDYIRAICGRVHMIPLILERREQEIIYDGKKSRHYILHVNMDFSLADLQKLALIDPTKSMLELPPVEEDKEDILFLENKTINQEPENQTTVIPGDELLISEDQALGITLEAKQRDGGDVKAIVKYFAGLLKCPEISDLTDIPEKHYTDIMATLTKKPMKVLGA
jgi:hypothetical protein